MVNPSYTATPASIDLGAIAFGSQNTLRVRVDFRQAPTSDPTTPQTGTAITSEVFVIDDQGSEAEDFITLSFDNLTYANSLSLASFPSTNPPNYVDIYIRAAPLAATSGQIDYLVYLTAKVNTQFRVPIHIQITGGGYISVNDLRRKLGPLGKERTTFTAIHDSFYQSNFPLWSDKAGTWVQFNANQRSVITSASVDAFSVTALSDFGDYNAQVLGTLTSAGTMGLVFGYRDNNNYLRFTVDSVSQNAVLTQIDGGVVNVLQTISVGNINVNFQLAMRVEKHPTSATFFLNEAPVIAAAGLSQVAGSQNVTGSPGIYADGSLATVVNWNEYHVNQDTYVFQDADLLPYIRAAEKFIERRTGKIYLPRTVTELLDYNFQTVLRMPYIVSRGFNTFPTLSAQGQPINPQDEKFLYLKYAPIYGVIALMEDQTADGSTANWQLRKQGRDGDYVVYPEQGRIVFFNNFPADGHQNLKVIYTLGSGTSEIPEDIKDYCAVIAAIRVLDTIGLTSDGVEAMSRKLKESLVRLEEFIPQATYIYAVGSGQFQR